MCVEHDLSVGKSNRRGDFMLAFLHVDAPPEMCATMRTELAYTARSYL
jgi:hypothetical protein